MNLELVSGTSWDASDGPWTRCTAPGLYERVPEHDYHAHPAVSKGLLDDVARSPLHAKYFREHPEPDSDAQLFGSAVHIAILEPDRYANEYAIIPADCSNRSTKKYKEWAAATLAERPGVQLLKQAQHDQVCAIADSVHAHPMASKLVHPDVEGPTELSCLWATSDQLCRLRMDKWVTGHRLIVDLKTTHDPVGRVFKRTVLTYRYHCSAAWYLQGASALGLEPWDYIFVVVEAKPPHDVACYRLPDALIEHAATLLARDFERWLECQAAGMWPGYSDQIEELDFEDWAYRN